MAPVQRLPTSSTARWYEEQQVSRRTIVACGEAMPYIVVPPPARRRPYAA